MKTTFEVQSIHSPGIVSLSLSVSLLLISVDHAKLAATFSYPNFVLLLHQLLVKMPRRYTG